MSWLIPSIVASLCGSIAQTLVFGFLYYQYRERHMGFWALGWGFFSLRYVFELGVATNWLATEMPHFIQGCVLVSGLLILRGTEEMVGRKMSPVFWIGGVLCAGWILLGIFIHLAFLPQNFPIFLFYAAVSIRTGLLFLAVENVGGVGRRLTGWGFILWGLHRANYPFLRSMEWLAPWRFLVAALLALIVAIGMLLVYFERLLATLATSESRFRTLVEHSTDGMFLLDLDGRILDTNRHACQSLGYSREQLLELSFHEVVRGLTQIILPPGPNRLAPGVPSTLEGLHRRRDGTTFPVELRISTIEHSPNQIQLLALARDVSRQKESEEQLRASKNRYRTLYQQFETLLNGIPDPITLVDRDMKIIWANQGAAHAFDQEQAEVSGQHCYRFWHRKDVVCDECPVVACFATGEFQERKIATSDGRVWGVKVFPIRDKDGQVVNALELISNITEKIRLREQEERTSRLASLGELAAGVAHEINNPNGLILLNLPVLVEAVADMLPILDAHARDQGDFSFGGLPFSRMRHELPEMLDEIKDGAMRIKRIVDDLKNFVRQDLSRSEEIDLNQAVQAAVRLTATEIRRATDRFSVACAESLPPVGGSMQRLEQVLVNLIVNACQALPDKNRSLAVVTRFDGTTGMIVVEVRDEGTGIAAANLKHLTEPFFTTRRERGGTGLGLAVSSRIVKEHGGELRFSSTPGQGTTATVLLPPYKRG